MTSRITTFSITLSVTNKHVTPSIAIFSRMTLSKRTFSIKTLSMIIKNVTLSLTTLSIKENMTLSMATLSKMTSSKMTFSITTLIITIQKMSHSA